jgi:SAM-dependent MidA family methyltransferase
MNHDPVECFEHFMLRALHDPLQGYYRTGLTTVGRGGDFSTSATLLPDLGKALASWLEEKFRVADSQGVIDVIEVGGGTGALMLSILKNLGWLDRRKFRFHSVETSLPLMEQQRRLLQGYGVRWHPGMREALLVTGAKSLIYSNELVDAFPCTVLGFQKEQWKELAIQWDGREARERWVEMVGERQQMILQELALVCPQPQEGQRVEIPWSYREWLESWLPFWGQGSLLTIDYGDLSQELMRRHRYGTLRSYFRHLRLEGEEIYRRVGQQDITYDVNFSLLQKWGGELGLKNVSLQSQAAFVEKRVVKKSPPTQWEEAHTMFRVLEQSRSGHPE